MSDTPLPIYAVDAPLDDEGTLFTAEDVSNHHAVYFQFLDTRDPEAFSQVQRMAMAASSISHPRLCRVLEVGEHCGRPFLTRELVDGTSLRVHLLGEPMEVPRLTEIATGLATALLAAHGTGIVMGNITAGNTYITRGGQPKLGGYAFVPAGALNPIAAIPPELARQEHADTLTDIFAFGAVLYEMATGEPPDTSPPKPPRELRPELPESLDALIRICLAADPAARFQSAEGLVRALTVVRRGGPAELIVRLAKATPARRRRTRRMPRRWRKAKRYLRWAMPLAAVVGLVWLAVQLWPVYTPFTRTATLPLTASGDLTGAAIAPDGASYAFVRHIGGKHSLWLYSRSRQRIDQLEPPSAAELRALAFSPDGKYLHYVAGEAESAALYRRPLDGSPTRKLVSNIITGAVSPDGQSAAYLRASYADVRVVVGRVDGSNERYLYKRDYPVVPRSLAWSPDSRYVAFDTWAPYAGCSILTGELVTGDVRDLGWHSWDAPVSMAWVPEGNALIVAGSEVSGTSPLWRVAFPSGETMRLSDDLESYSHISLSADGRSLTALRSRHPAAIWVARNGDVTGARRLTPGTAPDGVGGLTFTRDGRIVFTSTQGTNRGLWSVPLAGGQPQPLLTSAEYASRPVEAPDGRSIAFLWYRNNAPKIYAMDTDGRNLRPITHGGAEFIFSLAPDSRFIYFTSSLPMYSGLWRMPYEQGQPEKVVSMRSTYAALSPDGRLLAYRTDPDDGSEEILIAPSSGGPPTARFRIREKTPIAFTPAGDGIIWIHTQEGVGNLWVQPLSGDPPRPLTTFDSGAMYAFAFSPDHSQLAVSRGRSEVNVVLIHDNRPLIPPLRQKAPD